MTLHPLLEGLRAGPWGGPRYYPPGQHPAMHRLREHVGLMEGLREKLVAAKMDIANADECIDYARGQIAAFEGLESESKQRDLRIADRELRRALDGE